MPMSKIERLIRSYQKFIAVPWRSDAAPPQRVIFCIYDQTDELHLRARIEEFELATRQSGHGWFGFDLTNTFAEWLTGQRYAKSYYEKPHLLSTLLPKYLDYIQDQFEGYLESVPVNEGSVVALMGVGSLFGFLKVRDMVARLAPLVKGRLLVFFPGTYENNNYRLLDGYDGWNYHAVPITADRDF